jgi:putative peptidoglycan lipid II flippase
MVRVMKEKSFTMVQATSVVMVATLISMSLGILREVLIAAQFGATLETDAYFFAFALIATMPEFMLGAIEDSLIPIYVRRKTEGRADVFISTVLNTYAIVLVVVTGMVLLGAPALVGLLGAGLDASSQQLVVQLIWILGPTILLSGLWTVLNSLLNAEGYFFQSTISRAFLAGSVIAAILLLPPQLGIYRLPLGVLFAATVQLLWSAGWLWRYGFKYRFVIDIHEPMFRRFLNLLWPGLAGAGIGYALVMIDRSMAAYLSEGTISALNYAEKPMAVLTSVGIFSFTTALLPSLSRQTLEHDHEGFRRSISNILGLLVYVLTPLCAYLLVFRAPVIQVLFQRGRFDETVANQTADIFGLFVLGLVPMAIAVALSTIFNSLEDTKTPAIFGAGVNLISKTTFNFMFISLLGGAGLALGTSMMYGVSALLLLFILWRRLRGINGRYLLATTTRTLGAALVAGGAAYLIVAHGGMAPLLQLVVGGVVGGTIYLAVSALLRTPEFFSVRDYLLSLRNHRMVAALIGQKSTPPA